MDTMDKVFLWVVLIWSSLMCIVMVYISERDSKHRDKFIEMFRNLLKQLDNTK